MSKFKAGDVVVGKKSSSARYGCTSKENNWVGKVLKTISELDLVEVVTLESDKKECVGVVYYVYPKHFKLKKLDLIEIDISKSYEDENFSVLLFFDDHVMFSILDKLTLYIGEGMLSFKQANKILKPIGYKLINRTLDKI